VTPRRILLTTDVVGGVWDFCLTLGTQLRDELDIVLLAVGEPSAGQRAEASRAGLELRSEALKLEWMQDSAADVARLRELVRDVAAETRADLVHANQFAAACADLPIPVVLTLHSDVLSWRRWTLGGSAVPPEWRGYAALVDDALTRADSVVAVSAFLAHEVRELYSAMRAIDVIHNGWPAPHPHHTAKEPFTFVAGRAWDQAKSISLAAEAAQGDVYLAGEQHHPETGGKPTISSALNLLGHLTREQLDSWLDRAAIYLSPARYDPFGLLPLQAALHGCALLLSDMPSYRELWHGAACFFRSDDADDLRSQWRTLLIDEALRADLAQAARSRALERYAADCMASRYRELYARTRAKVPA
jgi:glycogen(starch) synthase